MRWWLLSPFVHVYTHRAWSGMPFPTWPSLCADPQRSACATPGELAFSIAPQSSRRPWNTRVGGSCPHSCIYVRIGVGPECHFRRGPRSAPTLNTLTLRRQESSAACCKPGLQGHRQQQASLNESTRPDGGNTVGLQRHCLVQHSCVSVCVRGCFMWRESEFVRMCVCVCTYACVFEREGGGGVGLRERERE